MSDQTISRRKLLGALGIAGTALAVGRLPYVNGGQSVTESVYGGGDGDECCACPSEVVNVIDYGVVGDGIVDDTINLQLAANEAVASRKTLFIPQRLTIKITATVNLRHITNIESLGTIVSYVDHAHAILAGGDSRGALSTRLYFARVDKGNTILPDDIGIRLVGLKNAEVTVLKCFYLQLYANAADATMSSIAYSTFYFGRSINTLQLYGEAGTSWINENLFYGGSFKKISLDGVAYNHNNNVFIKPSVEGAASIIEIKKGARNKFYDIRTEDGTQIQLSAGTYFNVLIDNYMTSGTFVGAANMSDNGQENIHLNSLEAYYQVSDIITINKYKRIYDGCAEYSGLMNIVRSGFDKLVASNNSLIFQTGIMAIDSIVRFRFESDAKIFRYRVYCYNEHKEILNDRLYIKTTGGWNQVGDYAGFTTNVDNKWVIFDDPAVKFANLVIYHTGPGSFEYVRLKAYYKQSLSGQWAEYTRTNQGRPLVQLTMPVRGLAYPGNTIMKEALAGAQPVGGGGNRTLRGCGLLLLCQSGYDYGAADLFVLNKWEKHVMRHRRHQEVLIRIYDRPGTMGK